MPLPPDLEALVRAIAQELKQPGAARGAQSPDRAPRAAAVTAF